MHPYQIIDGKIYISLSHWGMFFVDDVIEF